MKCPYCGKDMIYGVIQSPQEINWKPKKAKVFGAGFLHKEFSSQGCLINS